MKTLDTTPSPAASDLSSGHRTAEVFGPAPRRNLRRRRFRSKLSGIAGAVLGLVAAATLSSAPDAAAAPAGDKDKDQEAENDPQNAAAATAAVTSSLAIEDLSGSQFWPVQLRGLIAYGLSLTPRGLNYEFGSSDPDEGGMDCSGTLYHVMTHQGLKKVPRSSDDMFHWVEDAGLLNRVSGAPEQDDSSLAAMRPGDLLFWTGTYDTGSDTERISHVMMYLGKTTEGAPVMFGASNGRPYQGKRQNGVSVFDFRMPKAEGKARFVGYGPIPGMEIESVAPQPPTRGRPADTAQASLPAKKAPGQQTESSVVRKKRASTAAEENEEETAPRSKSPASGKNAKSSSKNSETSPASKRRKSSSGSKKTSLKNR